MIFHNSTPRFCAAAAMLGLAWLLFPGPISQQAAAATYTVLYDFCQQTNCADGAIPRASQPILDHSGSGTLYGATEQGGDTNQGVIYSLTPNGDGTYRYARLYSFCDVPFGCADGYEPLGPLVQDTSGNLYGINQSVAYELSPNRAHTNWRISRTKLFGDGFNLTGGLTYAGAAQGLAYDGVSPLYGMTFAGGASLRGAVYQLTPTVKGFRRKILHNFCAEANCADGDTPGNAVLWVDQSGSLYGTTMIGGAHDWGVLFQLKPNTRKTRWTETVLHDFCAQPHCADGRQPLVGVVGDQAGNLYGTTYFTNTEGESGTLYKFQLGKHPTFSVLHTFCQTDCSDGATPDALAFGPSGNLIGTTTQPNGGSIYRLDPATNNPQLTVLHASANTALGALAIDASGTVYGTTASGGANFGGVVFRLTP
jgi:uncharacterized repeat protein (TIGR03803 family)